jgi:hypothetical protein
VLGAARSGAPEHEHGAREVTCYLLSSGEVKGRSTATELPTCGEASCRLRSGAHGEHLCPAAEVTLSSTAQGRVRVCLVFCVLCFGRPPSNHTGVKYIECWSGWAPGMWRIGSKKKQKVCSLKAVARVLRKDSKLDRTSPRVAGHYIPSSFH